MNTEELMALIDEGRDAWNIWRGENPDIVPDLRGVILDGRDLQYYNFEKCWLIHASIIGANLSFANFRGADLRDTILTDSILDNANFDTTIISSTEQDLPIYSSEAIITTVDADAAIAVAMPEDESQAQIFQSTTNENGEVVLFQEENLPQYTIPIGRRHAWVNLAPRVSDSGIAVRLEGLTEVRVELPTNLLSGTETEAKFTIDDSDSVPKPETVGTLVDFSNRSDNTVPVLYGTNRAPVLDKDKNLIGYSGERSDRIHYGVSNVYIPKKRKVGKIKKSLFQKLADGIIFSKDVKLRSILKLSEEDFCINLKMGLDSGDDEVKAEVLIYIHGYNVDFKEAAIRAAQLGVDLDINGPVAFYSWPSKGKKRKYLADEASIYASEQYIEEFLDKITSSLDSKNVNIYVIAHSMGNRGLLNALKNIQANKKKALQLKHIILAAPDVDKDVFERDASSYSYCSDNTTLYVSDKDKAVSFSRYLHEYDRVGYVEPVTICDDIQTIKVSAIDVGLLGHGYYAESRTVITDINDALRDNKPRMQIDRASDGRGYWEVKP